MSNKNSNESAVSLHSKHLEDADTKSTSFFSAKAQTSVDLRRLDREPYSYSVHLIDLDTQLTLVFIAGARQFVENHFANTTIGRIRLLVDATFRRVQHLVEKNSQVRHLVEIVKSLFFDQTSYSTERRIFQMSLIIKKRKS